MAIFIPPPPCPQVSAFDQPLLRTSAFSIIHCPIWSDSVIAGAVKIRCSFISSEDFTPTPCGLICGSSNVGQTYSHPESKLYVGFSSSPYYTLWCKSYKMNNNLYFNRQLPQRECLQSMLKQ